MPEKIRKVRGKACYSVKNELGKVRSKCATLENAKKQVRLINAIDKGYLGGASLTGKEVKKLVSASYEEKKGKTNKIGDFELDKSLSSSKAKVYHNPKTNETVIANRGTTGTISDWSNNLVYGVTGSKGYKKTDRYKQAKKTQKKAIEKYGEVSNVGHSQGAEIARELNKEGLSKSVIMVNPASRGEKVRKNEEVIKSSGDVVSVLVPKKSKGKVKVIEAKSYNPLAQHSAKIIRGDDKSKMFGSGLIHEELPKRYM